MATEQEVRLKLTAESAGFKKDLDEARIKLYKLEAAGVAAAGGQKKYDAAIKKARASIKQVNGAYRAATTQLRLNEVQTLKNTKATVKLGKAQKRSNMAMTQFAYALDDMQYGFQGVQNNIQAMAVSLGLNGPLIIGITAVIAGIGYFTKQMKKANKAIVEQRNALKEKQGLIAAMLTHAEVLRETATHTDSYKQSLEKLKKNGYDPLTQSLNEYTDALIRQKLIESKLEANQGKIKDLLTDRIKLNNELQELEKGGIKLGMGSAGVGAAGPTVEEVQKRVANAIKHKLKEIQEINGQISDEVKIGADLLTELANSKVTDPKKTPGPGGDSKDAGFKDGVAYSHGFLGGANAGMVGADVYKNIKQGIQEVLELQKAGGADKEALIQSELAQLMAIDTQILSLEAKEDVLHRIKVLQAELANAPGLTDSGVGLTQLDKEFNKLKANLAEVKMMFEAGLYGFDEYIRRVENLTLKFGELDAAKQKSSEADALLQQGLANIVSGFAQAAGEGGDVGKALLSGIGNTLMQLGGLLIVTGIGVEAFKESLSKLEGVTAIVAGAAMVAAGAAFASAAKSAGGGGGGSSVKKSSGVNSVASPNPVRESSRNRGSDIVIPVDQLRYGMQVGESNYGSSS